MRSYLTLGYHLIMGSYPIIRNPQAYDGNLSLGYHLIMGSYPIIRNRLMMGTYFEKSSYYMMINGVYGSDGD
jgi:hypothetical protein